MLLKALFFALLVYLALRAVRNIIRAVLNDPASRRADRLNAERHQMNRDRPTERANGAEATSPRRRAYEVEIEDARWVDVD